MVEKIERREGLEYLMAEIDQIILELDDLKRELPAVEAAFVEGREWEPHGVGREAGSYFRERKFRGQPSFVALSDLFLVRVLRRMAARSDTRRKRKLRDVKNNSS